MYWVNINKYGYVILGIVNNFISKCILDICIIKCVINEWKFFRFSILGLVRIVFISVML